MYKLPGGALLCDAINGCSDVTQRLPPLAAILLGCFIATFVGYALCTFHSRSRVIVCVITLQVANLFCYLWVNGGELMPEKSVISAAGSLVILSFLLEFEKATLDLFPRSAWLLRIVTPVSVAACTALFWNVAGMRI